MSLYIKNNTTTEMYILTLHDALPICRKELSCPLQVVGLFRLLQRPDGGGERGVPVQGRVSGDDLLRGVPGIVDDVLVTDRKSTRLNSSHVENSYADICLKKKR